MSSFFQKTFGGITREFYWRQFFFGLFLYIPLIYQIIKSQSSFTGAFLLIVFASVSQFLFPYARFVYHSITDFLLGNNVFLVNAILVLIFRLFMAVLCWCFSIFIAPVGLIYLYFYNFKK